MKFANTPVTFRCRTGFTCAVLFTVGTTPYDGRIASVIEEDVPQISVYLGGTLYTITYDPPVRNDNVSQLRRGTQVPVRIEGNVFIVQWPDKTRSKRKIIQRDVVSPNSPQPA